MPDNSHFRNWLRNIWLDNCSEHEGFKELPYTMKEYFDKYKWWLKREYKFQNETNPKRQTQ